MVLQEFSNKKELANNAEPIKILLVVFMDVSFFLGLMFYKHILIVFCF